MYEYLLNREYAEPLALEHTMERKGVRSPSMRLRFGRRSDPDVPLISRVRLSHANNTKAACSNIFLYHPNRIMRLRMKSSRKQLDHRQWDFDLEGEMIRVFIMMYVWLPPYLGANYLLKTFLLLLYRSHYSMLTSHSVGRHREHHQFAFASVNETHPCLTMR